MLIYMSKIPILVLAFNRADHVSKAMAAIREYHPDKVYLACDGPRVTRVGEEEKVEAVKKTMLDAIDWPCNVKTLFRTENLGCANAVFEAITWFFENEEYGIICEDDVILSLDFFKLCEDLLPRYANEEKIMEISARNHSRRTDFYNSYVFSQCYHCWGWASWRRAWKKMDMSMSATNRMTIPFLIKRLGLFRGIMMLYYFKNALNHLDSFNSWATRWYLSILDNDGLVLVPGVNLAINIGMYDGAHYEDNVRDPYADLCLGQMVWPLVYNDHIVPDKKQKIADNKDFFIVRLDGLLRHLSKILNKIRIISH